jgi:hypothetical protein
MLRVRMINLSHKLVLSLVFNNCILWHGNSFPMTIRVQLLLHVCAAIVGAEMGPDAYHVHVLGHRLLADVVRRWRRQAR